MQLTEFMEKFSNNTCLHKLGKSFSQSTYYKLLFLVICLYLLALLCFFFDDVVSAGHIDFSISTAFKAKLK